ncbi:MAG: cobaltochelatase subunit CobN [Bilophila wadsworthia]
MIPARPWKASVGGAAKLDSLESVSRILRAMRQAGYAVRCPRVRCGAHRNHHGAQGDFRIPLDDGAGN